MLKNSENSENWNFEMFWVFFPVFNAQFNLRGEIQPTQGQIDARLDLISHQNDYSLLNFFFFFLLPTHNFPKYHNDEKTCREIFPVHILLNDTHTVEWCGGWRRGRLKWQNYKPFWIHWILVHNTLHIFPVQKKITLTRNFTETTKIASRKNIKNPEYCFLGIWRYSQFTSCHIFPDTNIVGSGSCADCAGLLFTDTQRKQPNNSIATRCSVTNNNPLVTGESTTRGGVMATSRFSMICLIVLNVHQYDHAS